MNNDYDKEALFYAASIFNERLGAEVSEDNLVLRCFQTENQQEVFEQFCKQYFPDRLEDRYTAVSYTHLDVYKRQAHTNVIASKTRQVFLCQVGTKKILRIYKPFIGEMCIRDSL